MAAQNPRSLKHLNRGWLIILRGTLALAFLLAIFVLISPSVNIDTATRNFINLTDALRAADLPSFLMLPYQILTYIWTAICLIAGLLIFWKRANDWLAVVVSISLITASILTRGAARFDVYTLPWYAQTSTTTIFFIATLTFMAAFPNGRAVPRWVKRFVLICSVYLVAVLAIKFFALDFYRLFETQDRIFRIAGMLGIGILAQAYRYLRVSNIDERAQTKWILLGILAALIGSFINTVGASIASDIGALLVLALVKNLLMISAPITLIFAILRYRLWDIDFVINRSLVYGGLTLFLGGIFIGIFALTRMALESTIQQDQITLAVAIATGVVAGLFTPTRTRLIRFVDQRLYGIELDYNRAIYNYRTRERAAQKPGHFKTHFGEYTQLKLLGRGGMSEVYLAHDTTLNHNVALKLMLGSLIDDLDAQQWFNREVQTIAHLDHPNIITLYDSGTLQNTPYIVMEHIDGHDLNNFLQQHGLLSLIVALPILQDIAAALDYAHQQGIVHRDIKPANVMIEHQTGRAVLMDFGIAHTATAITQLTGTGGMVGTLDYISPEQIHGASQIDRRADVYSLGVMAYQMLAGELPFRKANPGALVMAHLMEPPPDVREKVPQLSERVAEAIIRAMAKKPDERFSSAKEMIEQME